MSAPFTRSRLGDEMSGSFRSVVQASLFVECLATFAASLYIMRVKLLPFHFYNSRWRRAVPLPESFQIFPRHSQFIELRRGLHASDRARFNRQSEARDPQKFLILSGAALRFERP